VNSFLYKIYEQVGVYSFDDIAASDQYKDTKNFRHCQIKRELFSVDIRIFYVHDIGFCGHKTRVKENK